MKLYYPDSRVLARQFFLCSCCSVGTGTGGFTEVSICLWHQMWNALRHLISDHSRRQK